MDDIDEYVWNRGKENMRLGNTLTTYVYCYISEENSFKVIISWISRPSFYVRTGGAASGFQIVEIAFAPSQFSGWENKAFKLQE